MSSIAIVTPTQTLYIYPLVDSDQHDQTVLDVSRACHRPEYAPDDGVWITRGMVSLLSPTGQGYASFDGVPFVVEISDHEVVGLSAVDVDGCQVEYERVDNLAEHLPEPLAAAMLHLGLAVELVDRWATDDSVLWVATGAKATAMVDRLRAALDVAQV